MADRLARVVGLPADPADPPAYPWDSAAAPRPAVSAFDPGRRGVRVLAVLAVLVVGVAAFLAWRSRPQVTPAPRAETAASVPPSASPALLVVSVTGKVNRPGLVRLPAGSRVADAIEAAGGALPGADLTGLNLARKLVDGEMVAVGVPQPPGAAAPAAGTGAGPGLVNLNTASTTELQTLPGIGEVLAQRIVEYRDAHGGFRAVADLRKVEGIGDAKFQQLKDRVTV
ncbi:hypothetical protein GCM10010399_66120 [Dactylosporangium fulvum]